MYVCVCMEINNGNVYIYIYIYMGVGVCVCAYFRCIDKTLPKDRPLETKRHEFYFIQ